MVAVIYYPQVSPCRYNINRVKETGLGGTPRLKKNRGYKGGALPHVWGTIPKGQGQTEVLILINNGVWTIDETVKFEEIKG